MAATMIEIERGGHRFTAWHAGRVVTIARDGVNVAVGRWDDEDGIVCDPPVQLLPDTDDSEDVYGILSALLRAAALPS